MEDHIEDTSSGAAVGTAPAEGATYDDPSQPWTPPEQFKVTKEDGALDLEATTRKIDEARRHLELRFSSGDVRPKDASGYVIPDEHRDYMPDDWPEKAHAMGLTQAQMSVVMEHYSEAAARLVNGPDALDEATATAQLRQVWPDEKDYRMNSANAWRAVNTFGGDQAEELMQRFGNDPLAIQMFARIGAMTREDRALSGRAGGTPRESVEQLMAGPAYRDAKHPQHAAVSARVNAHFASLSGADKPVR